MFSSYCKDPFTVEKCEVENPEGLINTYPTLKYRQEIINVNKINRMVGIDETADQIADLLTRMCLSAKTDGDGQIKVTVEYYCR